MATILLADDSADDAFFLRHAFEKAGPPVSVTHVNDGAEVLSWLSDREPSHPLPELLILDLKMPRADGYEVLRWLIGHPEFKQLPAIVLSSSSLLEDEVKSLGLGARAFFTKPCDVAGYDELVHDIRQRFLSVSASDKPGA